MRPFEAFERWENQRLRPVNETALPVAPVSVVHEFLIEHGFENPEVIARIDSLPTEVVRTPS